jgi:hypothetical protein
MNTEKGEGEKRRREQMKTSPIRGIWGRYVARLPNPLLQRCRDIGIKGIRAGGL